MLIIPSAEAQTLWIGGAVQRDVQRFEEDIVPNRLDGSTTGWMAGGHILARRHLALVVEWSDAGTIEDLRTTTIDVNGRSVSVTSIFTHDTRTLAALAGFGHAASSRARLAYLVGVASTRVRREFVSDAGGLLLVPPSDRAAPGRSIVTDRFETMTGGIDALIVITRGLHAMIALRAQRLTLQPEISGWSARTMVGAGWTF